jgi:hypothetical protein
MEAPLAWKWALESLSPETWGRVILRGAVQA